MREFKTMCKDSVTGLQIVLSECSYNMACDWLLNLGFDTYVSFESEDGVATMKFMKPAKRTFVYDENRGYLLTD